MSQPSIVQQPKKYQFSSDSIRNVSGVNNSAYVSDYGYSSINILDQERNSTNKFHVININNPKQGFKVSLTDTPKTTNRQIFQDNSNNNKRNINPNQVLAFSNTGLTDLNPKPTHKESSLFSYTPQVAINDGMGYSIQKVKAKTTNKETTLNKNYIPNVHSFSTFENRNKFNNITISDSKEDLITKDDFQVFRTPNSSLFKVNANHNLIGDTKLNNNMLLKEASNTYFHKNVSNILNNPISSTQHGEVTSYKQSQLNENKNTFGYYITEQLKNNPYYNRKRNDD